MGIDIIIYLVFILFILLLLFYVKSSIKDLSERQNGITKAIDENYKALYQLEQSINQLKKLELANAKQSDFNENIMQNCEFLINSVIDERINEIYNSLGYIQQNLDEVTKVQDDRISHLELANEPVAKLMPNDDADRMQVLKLYGEGKSIDEIASMLNKSPQSINIILKSI